jgi:hypothetical protein
LQSGMRRRHASAISQRTIAPVSAICLSSEAECFGFMSSGGLVCGFLIVKNEAVEELGS